MIFLCPACLCSKEIVILNAILIYFLKKEREGERILPRLLENNKYSRFINTIINPIEYYDLRPYVNS